VPPRALDKEPDKGTRWWILCRVQAADTRQRGNFFAECIRRHSAKPPSPSPVFVTVTFLCRVPDKKYSAKYFTECPIKSTRQRSFCRCTVRRALFVECDTRQRDCRVFFRVCRVLQALDKAPDSGSDHKVKKWKVKSQLQN
jgi:hypothetical protein